MDKTQSIGDVQRNMLRRSIYVLVTPIFLIFAALACAGTPLVGTPLYTCPTPIPLPTSTLSLTHTPPPTSTTLAGTATPTVAATFTPYPTMTVVPSVTPYVMEGSSDFFVGDAVYVGTSTSTNGVRFRLQNVLSQSAPPDANGEPRSVYSWQLEIKNIGTADYEIFPSAQMYLSEISTAYGDVSGIWPPTSEAAAEIGVTFDDELYVLAPGQTQVFHLAAFGPAGEAQGFTFQVDPTVSEGSDTITWVNQTNPYCSSDIVDP